jgi:undecaprenyl-diphosphatase
VLWYFWRDWLHLGKAALRVAQGRAQVYEARLIWYIVLATVPAVIFGLTLEHTVETIFRNPVLVASALAFGSLLMWLADRYSSRSRRLADMTLGHALFVGLAQAFALVPGISRSGVTISAALAAGYRREDSARFSFLLSTPVIAGAAIHKVHHITFQGHAAWGCTLGTLSSAVVGYLAIRFLIRYLERHSLDVFVWYRLALAALVVLAWAIK